jgi:hypothetical protein
MRQPFRLLVTGSRSWTDARTIEQALAVILDRHPKASCSCTARAPAEPTPSPLPTQPGPRLPHRGASRRLAPVQASCQRRQAGPSSRHTGMAPHTALISATDYVPVTAAKTAAQPLDNALHTQTGRGPSPARCGVTAQVSMIRNMRGMTLPVGAMSDRAQAGRMHRFERCGLPPPEP